MRSMLLITALLSASLNIDSSSAKDTADPFAKFIGKPEKTLLSDPKFRETDGWTVGIASAEVVYGVQGVSAGERHAYLLVDLSTPAHTILDVIVLARADGIPGQDCRNPRGDSYTGKARVEKGVTTDAALAKAGPQPAVDQKVKPVLVWGVDTARKKFKPVPVAGYSCVLEDGGWSESDSLD